MRKCRHQVYCTYLKEGKNVCTSSPKQLNAIIIIYVPERSFTSVSHLQTRQAAVSSFFFSLADDACEMTTNEKFRYIYQKIIKSSYLCEK